MRRECDSPGLWEYEPVELSGTGVDHDHKVSSHSTGELTAEEQATWDRCASNAEYHYLGSGKTFIRFGKALAEAMLEMEKE